MARGNRLLAFLTFCAATLIGSPAFADAVPSPVHGVTIDSVGNLNAIVESLRRLGRKPTTRIVFDEFVPATDYSRAATRIHQVSYVMGELLDSFYVKQYSVADYRARAVEYLGTLGNNVDIWEVGNEINGEWVGNTPEVVAKMRAAYDEVKARGKVAALTLYYNEDCWEKPANEMFTWTRNNVPAYMKQGLDYVWVSYYEDDCNGLQPNWEKVFEQVAAMFPNSKVGIGECGTTRSAKKSQYINRYYDMSVSQPRFVGGYFWWYFKQDMVPYTKALWNVINGAILSNP